MAKNKKTSANEANGSKGLKVYKVENAHQKEEARMRKEKTIRTFLTVLIIILAIAAVFSAIKAFFPDLFGKFSLSGQLAAKVNGVPITLAQLDEEYARLPAQYQYLITKDAFLKQLIDEILLTQEATKQGFSVSEAEVNESLNTFMQENNLTQEKLNDVLTQKKLTLDQLRNLVKNQLLIEKLVQKEVKDKVNITTEQALKYYNDNPATFKVPETVTARHILIGLVNRTMQQSKAKAQEILAMLEDNNANFCELVVQYSDDSGSSDKCGEYTFPRGQMVPEFETAAFEQGIGRTRLVNTTFGYHIIWTINKTPESLVLFKDVEEQIISVLKTQQEKTVYSDIIAGLREKASIVNYVEQQRLKQEAEQEKSSAETEAEKTEAEAGAKTQVNVVAPAEPAKTETPAETETPPQIPEEKVVEKQKELEAETEKAAEVVEEEPAAKISFTECLKSKGAVLYGAYWDSSTKTQKERFGADASKINYIECGVQGDYRAQAAICTEAGIQAYPTWIIGNEKNMGILDIKQLETMTGCAQ